MISLQPVEPVSIDWSTALVDVTAENEQMLTVELRGNIDPAFRWAFTEALFGSVAFRGPGVQLSGERIVVEGIAGTQPADSQLASDLVEVVTRANDLAQGLREKRAGISDHVRAAA